jgi:hypothetical protein
MFTGDSGDLVKTLPMHIATLSPNALHSMMQCSAMVSYINISRRLVRWMRQIGLPRTAMRMRYVRAVHAYHLLDGSCSRSSLIYAMQTLLAGYVSVDEGDHYAQYYRLLREAIQELQELVKQYAENA